MQLIALKFHSKRASEVPSGVQILLQQGAGQTMLEQIGRSVQARGQELDMAAGLQVYAEPTLKRSKNDPSLVKPLNVETSNFVDYHSSVMPAHDLHIQETLSISSEKSATSAWKLTSAIRVSLIQRRATYKQYTHPIFTCFTLAIRVLSFAKLSKKL